MVSQTLHVYSPSDGRRFTRSYHTPYSFMPDRRYQLHHHDNRVMTMTDSEVESDPTQQRKRIAVACGRCRKRKIRCSGDPGGGQPCSNCKSAGTEPCLFLRVSSSEAAFRNDPNEFSYAVQDARTIRNVVPHGMTTYAPTPDLPPVGSHDILGAYRSGSAYSYATKPFYSGVPAYSMGYVEELSDYSIGSPPPPVLGQDLVPYPSWTSRADYGYGAATTTTSLVHRPAPAVAVDAANFSLSSMAAHLPGPSLGSTDRLLPAPSARSLSYASSQSYKALPPAAGTDPSPADAAAVLADMASSSYGGSFDASGLPYNSSTTSLQTHTTQGSRTNSEAYSPDTDSIFTEHEHILRSQGSAVDLHTYTYGGGESAGSSLRRGSASGGPAPATGSPGGSHVNSSGSKGSMSSSDSSSSSSNDNNNTSSSTTTSGAVSSHHGYMAMNSLHDAASNSHHHHDVPLAAPAAVSGATAPVAYLDESSGASRSHSTAALYSGKVHGDTRRAAVAGSR